jgi:hypothetical protein
VRPLEPDIDVAQAVQWFCTAGDNTFTLSTFSVFPNARITRLFASTAAAEAAWPQCRVLVWHRTPRMTLPRAAKVFDRLILRRPIRSGTLGSTSSFRSRGRWARSRGIGRVCRRLKPTTPPRRSRSRRISRCSATISLLERQAYAAAQTPYHQRGNVTNAWPRLCYGGALPVGVAEAPEV